MSNISSGEGSFFRDLLGEGADAVVVSMDQFGGRCWHSSEELKSSFAINATARIFEIASQEWKSMEKEKPCEYFMCSPLRRWDRRSSARGSLSRRRNSLSIPSFLMVNDQFFVGGQPPMEDFARLKAKGIRVIVNLRHPAEYNAAEEEAKAKELGLRYFNIPVNPGDLRDAQVSNS